MVADTTAAASTRAKSPIQTSSRTATAHGKPWTTQVAIALGTPKAIHHVKGTTMVPLNPQKKTQEMASTLPQLIRVATVKAGKGTIITPVLNRQISLS